MADIQIKDLPLKTTLVSTDQLPVDDVDGMTWKILPDSITDYVQTTAVVQSWDGSTTPVDVVGGAGIDITNGIISLTGTGPSVASGFISVVNYSTVISYTNTTTWKALVGDIESSIIDNFQVSNAVPGDPTTPFYLQYIGIESGLFEFNCSFAMRRFSSAAANGYYLSASLDGINPLGPALGNRQVDYGLSGQDTINSRSVSYTVQIPLDPNDKVYFVVRNWGPSVSPTDNDFLSTECLISAKKLGDVGGSNSGVVSLGGMDGILGTGATFAYSGSTLQTTAMTGDVTTSANSFATTIAPLAVTNSKIANSTIDLTTKVTGLLPIANGGTNASSQLPNTVNYYDGSKITTSANLTFNGVGAVNLSAANSVVALAIINYLNTGVANDAHLLIQRNDNVNGTAHLKLRTIADAWKIGLFPGDESLHFQDATNSNNTFSMLSGGEFKITEDFPIASIIRNTSSGTATVGFQTSTTQDWTIGYHAGSSDLFFDNVLVGTALSINKSDSTLNIPTVAADNLLATDSSQNIIAASGTYNISISGSSGGISGVLPISQGGTNKSSQIMDGINYFDGSQITSASTFTYNGSNAVTLIGPYGTNTVAIVNTTSGGSHTSELFISRFDSTFGAARITYATSSGDEWRIGTMPGDSNYHFYDFVNSTDRAILKQTGAFQLNSLTASQLVATNGSKELSSGNLSGDVASAALVTTIQPNAVTYAKFQQVAANSLVGNSTGSLANAVGIPLGNTLTFNAGALQTTAITGDVTASANSFATTVAKINGATLGTTTATSGHLLIADGTQWVSTAMSGDATITSGGVLTIANLAVTNAKIANSTIDLTTKVTGSLPPANGGTGQSSYTIGDMLYASGSTTLSKLADVATGSVLVSGGVGTAPAYSTSPTLQFLTLSGLNTFSLVFTDTNKRLTTTAPSNPQGQGLTGATSYGANRLIFQNSGNTAFSSAASLTYDAASSFTFSTTGAPFFTVKSTTTGSSNEGAIRLDRGDSANGYAQLHFAAAGSDEWAIGTRAGTTLYNWFSVTGGANVMTLSSGGDLTNLLGNVIINTATKGLQLKAVAVSAGTANAYFITGVTLVGGTVTINSSVITTSCTADFTVTTDGGTPGAYRTKVAAGSVTVTSTSGSDTSTGNISIIKGV